MKFHGNPSCRNRADTCIQTDMTKQMDASHNYAKTLKDVLLVYGDFYRV
jgi:hypothetical protein